jgi:hypothetical protein
MKAPRTGIVSRQFYCCCCCCRHPYCVRRFIISAKTTACCAGPRRKSASVPEVPRVVPEGADPGGAGGEL